MTHVGGPRGSCTNFEREDESQKRGGGIRRGSLHNTCTTGVAAISDILSHADGIDTKDCFFFSNLCWGYRKLWVSIHQQHLQYSSSSSSSRITSCVACLERTWGSCAIKHTYQPDKQTAW